MVGIAGVSGSGKSSLISDTLVPMLKVKLKSKCIYDNEDNKDENINKTTLEGFKDLAGCYIIDQKPIARTKTSCPATYTGITDKIRELFAKTEKSINKGYSAGIFSKNSEGSCEKFNGEGMLHHYVGYGNFIDAVCDECNGTGYTKEARDIKLDSKNICDVLNMSVDEAYEFFKDKDSSITNLLEILKQVGMGYITLGQATPTISGGESQRIKLAK